MAKDQYANYVVQKMIGAASEEQLERLVQTIRQRIPHLKKVAYGKHIVAKIEKILGHPL